MRIKSIAVMTLVALLAVAPAAFAFGGGGGGKGGGSGTFVGSFSGDSSGGNFQGTVTGPDGNPVVVDGTFSGVVQGSEPLSMLLVGLGLLGARYLRRR